FIDRRSDNHLYDVCVAADSRFTQAALYHLDPEIFQREVFDVIEWHVTDVRIKPVLQAAFPRCQRGRSHRLALAVLHLLQPNLGLFTKRNAVVRTNDFLEMLCGIRSAGLDYFLSLAFPFG